MNGKTRSLKALGVIAGTSASLLAAGALTVQAADWLPWGSKSKTEDKAAPTPAAAAPASGSKGAPMVVLPSFADIAAQAEAAVVNISTTQTVKNEGMGGFGPFGGGPGGPGGPRGPFGGGPGGPEGPGGGGGGGGSDPFDQFFRRFNPQPPKSFKARSLGSGFIISADGMIVTNNHVVEHADEIQVKISSGGEKLYKAKVLGLDPKTDLAVIKIEPQGTIPFLKIGDSDKLRVGDWVVAIGNPFGLEQTVTSGIVSAKGRVIGQGPYDDFIQTDASINPGNSGGPLINLQAEVIGINSAIFSETGGNMGIGFAIPANLAKGVIEQLKTKGKVTRGWLGVMIQDVTEDLAKSFNLPEAQGALVSGVKEGGPGAKGGIERGDIILDFGGQKVKSSHELPTLVAGTPIGKDVDVKLLRDGKEKTVTVKVGELPKEAEDSAPGAKEGPASDNLGLRLTPVTPEMAKQLNVEAGSGLLVQGVRNGSAAEDAGLQPGDVIQEANRKPVKTVEAFKDALQKVKEGENILLLVHRGDSSLFITMKR